MVHPTNIPRAIDLFPVGATKMEELTGFIEKGVGTFMIGDSVVITAPNGDRATGTIADFYGVGRVAGVTIVTPYFGLKTYHFYGDAVIAITHAEKEN